MTDYINLVDINHNNNTVDFIFENMDDYPSDELLDAMEELYNIKCVDWEENFNFTRITYSIQEPFTHDKMDVQTAIKLIT